MYFFVGHVYWIALVCILQNIWNIQIINALKLFFFVRKRKYDKIFLLAANSNGCRSIHLAYIAAPRLLLACRWRNEMNVPIHCVVCLYQLKLAQHVVLLLFVVEKERRRFSGQHWCHAHVIIRHTVWKNSILKLMISFTDSIQILLSSSIWLDSLVTSSTMRHSFKGIVS